MKILAIDISTSLLSLAISDDDKLIYEVNKKLKKMDHAKFLIGELKKALDKVTWKLKNLDIFCVGLGPGSFTGLRVALSTIEGLNLAYDKKVLGIASMDAVAYNINEKDKIIACIQDAKKQKLYGCLYKYRQVNQLVRLKDYLLLNFDEYRDIVVKTAAKEKKGVIFTGEGINVFKKDILKTIDACSFAAQKYWYPYARNLTKLALEHIRNRRPFNSIDEIEPLYLHSQYANITKPKKL